MLGFVQILGGLGLFVFGISMLSSGMEKLAGEQIQKWLDQVTNSRIKSMAFGTAATALLVLWGAATPGAAQDVKVTHEPGTDFSRYKTYDWVETQEPVANPVNHVLINGCHSSSILDLSVMTVARPWSCRKSECGEPCR